MLGDGVDTSQQHHGNFLPNHHDRQHQQFEGSLEQQHQPPTQAMPPRRKKARRAPRKKKQAGVPYSAMSWEERKKLQELDELKGRQRWHGATVGAKQDDNLKIDNATPMRSSTEEGSAVADESAQGHRHNRKRPREQPPPAPCNTTSTAVAERAIVLPSAPHTPHTIIAIQDPSLGSQSSSPITSRFGNGMKTSVDGKKSLHTVPQFHPGDSDFNAAFDSAMSSIYEDMESWDKLALIAGIRERDEKFDRLESEFKFARTGGGLQTAQMHKENSDVIAALKAAHEQTVKEYMTEQEELTKKFIQKEAEVKSLASALQLAQDELAAKSTIVDNLNREIALSKLNLDLQRSTEEIEADEASAFAD